MSDQELSNKKFAHEYWQRPEEIDDQAPIMLYAETAHAVVNPLGGYVESFSCSHDDGNTVDLFYPKQEIAKKLRGGMHICLPNFGKDVTGRLSQHGFGRNAQWSVQSTLNTESTRLLLIPPQESEYRFLGAQMVISLYKRAITTDLLLTNEGEEPLRVAPAFHPYFALPNGVSPSQVAVNGELTGPETLLASVTHDTTDLTTVETPQYTATLENLGFDKTTIWSDGNGDYICVEPSANGSTFLEPIGDASEYLQPKQQRMYRTIISFALK